MADDPMTQAVAAEIAAIEARRAGGAEIEIGPDEADVVMLFFAMGSQWRYHASGCRLGLDYAAVPAAAGMLDLSMTPLLFDDLRVMERAALEALA